MNRGATAPAIAAACTFAAFATSATALPRWTPGVVEDLFTLPHEPISETVVTKAPQSIDVTVVSVPPSDVVPLTQRSPGFSGDKLDPTAQVVLHFVSAPPATGSPLEHQIKLSSLAAGFYQVRLSSPERTAIQNLNVGTVAAMINRGTNGAVLMAVDVRSRHVRTDVAVAQYTPQGVQKFTPSADGLVHLPPPWPPAAGICTNNGGLAVTAADGSIVPFAADPCPVWGLGTYSETDRRTYRPNDRVYYRVLSRDSVTNTYISPIGAPMRRVLTKNHFANGNYVIPPTAPPMYSQRDGFRIVDSMHSRYVIDAAALTPVIWEPGDGQFVVSATRLDGAPATKSRIRYGWHEISDPEFVDVWSRAYGTNGKPPGDLQYGDATLNATGDAVISVPVNRSDVELYAFDPDTGVIAATARIKFPSYRPNITITAPIDKMGPSCIPLLVRETTAQDAPVANRRMHLEVQPGPHFSNTASPLPALVSELTTDSDGYATARWCAKVAKDFYQVYVRDEHSGLDTSVAATVADLPDWRYGLVVLSVDRATISAGTAVTLTATSTDDGAALVFYGSGYDFHTKSVRLNNGSAHLQVPAPSNLDDFSVGMTQPTRAGQRWAYKNVAVTPRRHQLHVEVACLPSSYRFCAKVFNWRGTGVPARLFVDVTMTTRAGIVNELTRSSAAYDAFYSPVRTDYYSFTSSWQGNYGQPAAKSYLYSLPEPTRAPPNNITPATPEPTPSTMPLRPQLSQTALWLNNVHTDKRGSASVSIANHLMRGRLYLIHVIALGENGAIGEAYGWTR